MSPDYVMMDRVLLLVSASDSQQHLVGLLSEGATLTKARLTTSRLAQHLLAVVADHHGLCVRVHSRDLEAACCG